MKGQGPILIVCYIFEKQGWKDVKSNHHLCFSGNQTLLSLSSPLSLSRVVMYCLASFSRAATVFTAFTAAFYTVEPRSYQQRDKSLQCHVILSSSHKSIISLFDWYIFLVSVWKNAFRIGRSACYFGNAWERYIHSLPAMATILCGKNVSTLCQFWQPDNSRQRWKVSRKGRMKVSHLAPHYPMKPVCLP